MVARRPVVVISGQRTELPPGDSIVGGSVGVLTAGSGLDGGGDLSSTTETNVSLAPNPSGLIFVDNKYLATDGVAQRTGETALASGNYALAAGAAALASGIAGSSLAATALASGNAALADITAIPGGTIETFTAASAVASGYAVGLDDTGSVQSVVSTTTEGVSFPSSAVVFESDTTDYVRSTFDSTNSRVVIVYRDGGNSNYPSAIVGTVSGTSISFGTAVVIASETCFHTFACYEPVANRVVATYRQFTPTDRGRVVLGTVSGTSISFGGATTFSSGAANFGYGVFDSANNKIIITYQDQAASFQGKAVLCTVSGNSITIDHISTFTSNSVSYPYPAFDSTNNKVVVAYRDNTLSNYGYAAVGTYSASTLSWGTPVVFEGAQTSYPTVTYDSTNNRIVIAYVDGGNSQYGTAIVGTVSGTSISFGTAAVFSASTTSHPTITFDSTNSRVFISYIDVGNSYYGTAIDGTVSGTSISFGTAVVFESAAVYEYMGCTYDSTNNRTVVSYSDQGNSYYGTSIVADALVSTSSSPTLSSQNNFIGIAQTTAASGSAVQVRLPGSYDQNNTGLTPGAVYYVDPTTSGFTTTATQPSAWSGAVNWGPIGRAVNSTTLLLTDMI